MIKIFLLPLVLMLNLLLCPAFAGETEEVETFFEDYVNDANSYSKAVADYYLPDAKIIRVVVKPDGTTESVEFPMSRYKSELKKGQKLARLARYKNTYSSRKYEKLPNGDYKIAALRTPRNDKTGLPFYFIVTKTGDGWKVKEESMHTTVQKFLSAK